MIVYLLFKFFFWEIGFALSDFMYEILMALIVFFGGAGTGLYLAKLVVQKEEYAKLEG
jgi:hypothetical protein